jgi:outer membrane protein, heavy metal efflux system
MGFSMLPSSRRCLVIATFLLNTGPFAAPGVTEPRSSVPEVIFTRAPDGQPSLPALRKTALEHSPRLAEARAKLRQAEAEVAEARLYANPTLQVEAEELPSDFSTGPGLLMTTLNQALVTGGKRRFRVRGARAGAVRATRQYEQEALEVLRDTTKAYYDLLGARRRLEMAGQLAAMVDHFRRVVRTRVTEGVARPIESERVIVLSGQARADIRKADADVTIAGQNLSSALGTATFDPATVHGTLEHRGTLPPIADLERRALAESPALAIPDAELAAATAERDLARALRVPDVEVGLSVQHQSDPDRSHDLRGFQLNVPLPVFNRGQAVRARAAAVIGSAEARRRSARLTLLTRLTQAYRTAQRAHEQIEIYLDEVLPAARTAVQLGAEGYEAGKFTYLEVLDGQRSLIGATQAYVEALVDYQKARADLEEIVAGAVPEMPETDDEADPQPAEGE